MQDQLKRMRHILRNIFTTKKPLVHLALTSKNKNNQQPLLLSHLLAMYREEYVTSGGDKEKIESYAAQKLLRKIKDNFGDQLEVKLADQRRGNFIYSSALSENDAKARLLRDGGENEENEKIKWTALHLRKQILLMS